MTTTPEDTSAAKEGRAIRSLKKAQVHHPRKPNRSRGHGRTSELALTDTGARLTNRIPRSDLKKLREAYYESKWQGTPLR